MATRVLIVQSNKESAQQLADFFNRRGDQVYTTDDIFEGERIIRSYTPALLLCDLHHPNPDWPSMVITARNYAVRVLMTNRYPDLQRELTAKEHGARVFLRAPFERKWVERALRQLESDNKLAAASATLAPPKVVFPLRLKITVPFILLGLAFVAGAAYLVSRYALESLQERFSTQLVEAGKQATDRMVEEEQRRLAALRVYANTEGVAEAILARDGARLQALGLALAVNNSDEAVEFLNAQGVSVLSLRRQPNAPPGDYRLTQGDNAFARWGFVQKVLTRQQDSRGDKFAGAVRAPWGDYFYVAGPVFDAEGRWVGAVLVGTSLPTLAAELRQSALAHITFYDFDGAPLVSTLFASEATPLPAEVITQTTALPNLNSPWRTVQQSDRTYSEIMGVWEARREEQLGVMGVALAQNFFVRQDMTTSLTALLLVTVGLVLVVSVGVGLASQLARPLSDIVAASQEVAKGNFNIKVTSHTRDELAVLAHAFNRMVAGLQEGHIYRDLLGRAVSPEVREQLRQSFASGGLRLEGQTVPATVMMSDIRGFTTLAEKQAPTTVMQWLNEYFNELVPVITAHGGVVDKFEGDAILSFFGVLPGVIAPRRSAAQACQTALDMIEVIDSLNARRLVRGELPLITGIGINTGVVVAGGLGAADRLNYTIIGDAVNTTQRLESLTRNFQESSVVVSESTYEALGGQRNRFRFEPLGDHLFKGKSEPVKVYRLLRHEAPLASQQVFPELTIEDA